MYTEENFIEQYEDTFGHEPDIFTLKKWNKQSEQTKFDIYQALSFMSEENDKYIIDRMEYGMGRIKTLTSEQLCDIQNAHIF